MIPAYVWIMVLSIFLTSPDKGVQSQLGPIVGKRQRRVGPLPLDTHARAAMEKIPFEHQDQSAVKSDDTPVNVEMWVNHFLSRGE